MSVNVPVRSVTPANAHGVAIGPAVTDLPAPTTSGWGKQDLSAPDAGRLESGRMLKKRVSKADRLNLKWEKLSRKDAARVLQAFDPEYILAEYLDAKLGDWRTEHFYVGDMETTDWTPHTDTWGTVSLPIIRATPDKG